MLAGQTDSYEQGSLLLEEFVGVKVSDSTIYRATQKKGEQAGKILAEQPSAITLERNKDDQEPSNIYGAVDGSMINIRGEGWKECKLGRLYRSEDISTHSQAQRIDQSIFAAHIGESEEFIDKFEQVIRVNKGEEDHLILLGDGATWINKYFKLYHPDCVRILDFYHVTEKIKTYASDHLNPKMKQPWVDQMCHDLLAKGGRFVCNQIKDLEPKRKKAKKAKQSLLKYFMNNLERMDYPYYDTMNYYIGSGTIESAHKFVIHQRMRRSGQRWSRRGANAVMNLRVLRYNNSWNLLFPILNNAA